MFNNQNFKSASFVSDVECSSSSSSCSSQKNLDKDISDILYKIMQNKKVEDIFDGGSTKKIEDIIHTKIHNGMSFLHYAVLVDNKSVVETLINKGADVKWHDDIGNTPLHYAQSIKVARLLIDAKADINATNNQKHDILTTAYILDNIELVAYLIKEPHIDVRSTKEYCGIPVDANDAKQCESILGAILYGDDE